MTLNFVVLWISFRQEHLFLIMRVDGKDVMCVYWFTWEKRSMESVCQWPLIAIMEITIWVDWKWEAVVWKVLFVLFNNCDCLLVSVCVVYTEDTMYDCYEFVWDAINVKIILSQTSTLAIIIIHWLHNAICSRCFDWMLSNLFFSISPLMLKHMIVKGYSNRISLLNYILLLSKR